MIEVAMFMLKTKRKLKPMTEGRTILCLGTLTHTMRVVPERLGDSKDTLSHVINRMESAEVFRSEGLKNRLRL